MLMCEGPLGAESFMYSDRPIAGSPNGAPNRGSDTKISTLLFAVVLLAVIAMPFFGQKSSATSRTLASAILPGDPMTAAVVNADLTALALAWDHAKSQPDASQEAAAALSLATVFGNRPIVAWLLDHGVDPNARTISRRTALINAPGTPQSYEVTQMLLIAGARRDLVDPRGNSALMEALKVGDTRLVELLLATP